MVICYVTSPRHGHVAEFTKRHPQHLHCFAAFHLPLTGYNTVTEFLSKSQMDGKFKRRLLKKWHIDQTTFRFSAVKKL
jgi:hypothetical protein